jgi:hypothetical protein
MNSFSPNRWRARSNYLFKKADAIEDAFEALPTKDIYEIPLKEFQKQQKLYREASLINMFLETLKEYFGWKDELHSG